MPPQDTPRTAPPSRALDQAFPTAHPHYATSEDTGGDLGHPGMTLHDYIATQAMAAFIARGGSLVTAEGVKHPGQDDYLLIVARGAANAADALLKELAFRRGGA